MTYCCGDREVTIDQVTHVVVEVGPAPGGIHVVDQQVASCPECRALTIAPAGTAEHQLWHDRLNDQLRTLGLQRP